jgi:hypothetical protein
MLEPKPREELIRANLVEDDRAKSLVSFFSAKEPVRRSANLATRALGWPAGAKVFVTGELLRVELGTAVIEIPNGAVLAPKNAELASATDRARQLLERGSDPPTVRAAKRLARQNRWTEVVKLTDDVGSDASPDLLVLRLRGLLHMDRLEEARELADTEALRTVAARARTAVDARVRQLEERRKLASKARVIATQHFDLRHDPSLDPAIASRIGALLEAELARVLPKLPPFMPRRVWVNILGDDEFRGQTQSEHILGVYDGEILIPLTAVERFTPRGIALMTHELTHALLAQVADGRAPRWFQEGVATRMELVERQPNAFSGRPAGAVLPVPLLDAMMEKSTDQELYAVAHTFIRFLEDRYGANAVERLAGDFARGGETVFGKSLDELNVEFREWGAHHNGQFVMSEPWPYQ